MEDLRKRRAWDMWRKKSRMEGKKDEKEREREEGLMTGWKTGKLIHL